MASDFVRNIKDVRNIDILSRNTVTENDLISTTDGEVYVVTKKGYRKITNIETKDFEALKNQADTNTLNISDLTDDIESLTTTTETNTSDIKTLKTSTDTNTSDISTLQTNVGTNTTDISTLQTDVITNTTDIGTIETKTLNNESEISNLINSIDNLNENISKLNEYIEVKTFNDIDLMDINSLDTLPLGVNYVLSAKNTTEEMKTKNGWLTVHYGNNVKRLMFQPYSEGRIFYNYIWKNKLGQWQSNTTQYYTLFEGSEQGVGSTIQLNDDFHNYYMIFISGEFPGGVFTEPILVKALLNDIAIQRINLRDSDGTFLGAYEVKLTPQPNNILEITNDVSWDEMGSTGSGMDRNAYHITNIEGVK